MVSTVCVLDCCHAVAKKYASVAHRQITCLAKVFEGEQPDDRGATLSTKPESFRRIGQVPASEIAATQQGARSTSLHWTAPDQREGALARGTLIAQAHSRTRIPAQWTV
jgi:hypothetical protein